MQKIKPNWLGMVAAGLLFISNSSGAFCENAEKPSPFAEPSTGYMLQFAEPHETLFVYERYDAKGQLYSRSIDQLADPVKIEDALHRTIGTQSVKLRGLVECPTGKVEYQSKVMSCDAGAEDYMGGVYARAHVILCKTLVISKGETDPASCFALVGDGGLDPYGVANDDDSMVFLGFADIGVDAKGRPARPDLLESKMLGEQQ